MTVKTYMKQNMYRWHRTSSIIIALPVMLWAISGLMHPVMTNFRPNVSSQAIAQITLDSSDIKMPLHDILLRHRIDSIHNFRIVQIAGQLFYQVKVPKQDLLRYFSMQDGKELKNGDIIYSRYLAKYFLEQRPQRQESANQNHAAHLSSKVPSSNTALSHDMDCCLKVTNAVMRTTTGSRVTKVERVTSFNEEYKYVNHLLPVYKVTFNRPDGIRLYVDPSSDRFASAVDNNRARFDRFFSIFHTWSWMDGLGDTRYVLMILITGLGFFTSLVGLYIFFTTSSARKITGVAKTRRLHRVTAMVASVFVLMFLFSGGYHALSKITEKTSPTEAINNKYATKDIRLDFPRLQTALPGKKISNISFATISGQTYFQVSTEDIGKKKNAGHMQPARAISYVHVGHHSVLHDGEQQYALQLSKTFSGYRNEKPKKIGLVTAFNEEYPFVNKRLPVWRIQYDNSGNERFFVETSSGVLASKVRDADLYEGYSFALLHKHHFMDWGGKLTRDTSTMVAVSLVFFASFIGTLLWFRSRKLRGRKSNLELQR